MMNRLILCGFVLLSIAGCSPKSSIPQEPRAGDLAFAQRDNYTTAQVKFGIGDAETSIDVTLTLKPDQDMSNISEIESITSKYVLAKLDVNVVKPYPEQLLIEMRLESFDNFPGHAVQVKPRIFFDDVQVDLDALIYGSLSMGKRDKIVIDAMQHLNPIPKTVLVRGELEINLFLDTDETTVTGDTPVTPSTQSLVKLTNPIRINFHP